MKKIEEKVQETAGVRYRYRSDWIHKLESESHWRLYWRQQKLMDGKLESGDSILELGVGTGFTANYLRYRGYAVVTVDIDADKLPDIVANVVEWDSPEQYDHVCAFEVFEHLPFEQFKMIFGRLIQKCRKNFFLSAPEATKEYLSLSFNIRSRSMSSSGQAGP